jgi:serine palmitoyltransferase
MASSSLTTDDDGPGVAVKNASREALGHYGCGSCGPRGFYGTIDVHLALEEKISRFTQTEGAIMYSDGASTVSSTIAAFAKRGDLLVVDEGVYEPLLTGISLSRANVEWFRHNDMVRWRFSLCRYCKTMSAKVLTTSTIISSFLYYRTICVAF